MKGLLLGILFVTAASAAEISPDGRTELTFSPGKENTIKITATSMSGDTLWEKTSGANTWIRPYWSEDGRILAIVTNNADPHTDLAPPNPLFANYLFFLNARTGEIIGEVDIDTQMLPLIADVEKEKPVPRKDQITISADGTIKILTVPADPKDTVSGTSFIPKEKLEKLNIPRKENLTRSYSW